MTRYLSWREYLKCRYAQLVSAEQEVFKSLHDSRRCRNRAGETILALYAEDRDSSEWQPISRMKPDHIRMIDDSPLEFKWKGSSDSPIT